MLKYHNPTAEQLIAAKDLIRSPDKWTRDFYARDSDGVEVSPDNSTAVCWCALGAIAYATNTDWNQFWSLSSDTASALLGAAHVDEDVPAWNDDPARTHAEVMEGFDRAIAAAKALEAKA